MGVDPALLHAWLAARSIARGLPAPVADHGGFRVDTGSEAETVRWVFPQVAGLGVLARTIAVPRHVLKLCGTDEELRAVLPAGWQLHALSYFMTAAGHSGEAPVPAGYAVERNCSAAVTAVRIRALTGEIAASGYAAETGDAFVYDRILTAAGHRRRGLGRAVMAALHQAKRNSRTPGLLVATEAGRALYETLGWRTISPYSTASISSPTDS